MVGSLKFMEVHGRQSPGHTYSHSCLVVQVIFRCVVFCKRKNWLMGAVLVCENRCSNNIQERKRAKYFKIEMWQV